MIFTERTIRVSNGTSSISSPIILYKGDKNIKIRFKIVDCPYTYSKNVDNIIETSEASYAQLIIKTPNNGTPILSDITEPENGYVTFIITGEMIDEAKEVGEYSLQVRLLDDEQYGRITIPEVVDGIEVREPMVTEGVSTTNEVDVAVADYAVTTSATVENVFDSEGNYIETNWQSGNVITSAKLNKIEKGITGVNSQIKDIANELGRNEDGNLIPLETTAQEIRSAINELKSNQGGGTGTVPDNVALLEDVTVDGETEDYIPLMALNGTEYRLTINNLGVPVIKNINGDIVFTCGTGGSSSGGDAGGSEGGGAGDTKGWTNGVAYTLTNIENSYVTQTGKIEAYNGWNRTDYINCAGASKITVSGITSSSNYNCFYDLNKNFISSFGTAANDLNEISVPENACYFILSSSNNYSTITVIPYE